MKKSLYGRIVRAKREALKMSLRDLARRLNVSPSYQSKVEREETRPPSDKQIKKTAELLQLDKDELFTAARKPEPEIKDIIAARPQLMMGLLRYARTLDNHQLRQLIDEMKAQS